MPHRPEWMEGMERLVRHDGESRDTDRPTWSHHRRCSGGQGARREAGSERLEENHRVVINGSDPERGPGRPKTGNGRARTLGAKAQGFHPVAPRCVRATRWGRASVTQGGLVSSIGKVWLESCDTRRRKGEKQATQSPA